MGAWGNGPFDSDGALDELGFLADRLGVDVDRDPVARPDQGRAVALVRDALAAGEDPHVRYAVAGLVVAVLDPTVDDDRSSGTRLFATIPHPDLFDPVAAAGLGLSGHCGYAALLTVASARVLAADALTAVDGLLADPGWLSVWRDQDAVTANLRALRQLLADVTGAR